VFSAAPIFINLKYFGVNVMKTITALVVSFLLFSSSVLAELDYPIVERVQTGKTPSQLFMTTVGPIVYCAGYDANFNGEYNDGDEAPSLWLLKVQHLTFSEQYYIKRSEKLIDLDFKMPLLPIRNHWDHFNRLLFVINSNSIDTVSFSIHGEINSNRGRYLENIENVSAVSTFEKKLYISVRPDFSTGLVYVYDIDKKLFTDTIIAGSGVQMTEYVPDKNMLIILNEGNFGADDGSIQMVTFEDDKPKQTQTYPVGGTPNHFLVSREIEKIIITCNASNNIIFMNYQQEADTIHLDLPEYDGPRETNLCLLEMGGADPLHFAITTYEGNVYIVDRNGKMYDTLDAKGKAETMFSMLNDIMIITPFVKGTYNPDTAVTIYSKVLSAEDDIKDSEWYIFPNPVEDVFSIVTSDDVTILSAEIINILGETVDNIEPETILTNMISTDIKPGGYFIRISHNKGLSTIPFIVK